MTRTVKVKEPARPPYVLATGPTNVPRAEHAWVKGELVVIERIPHRSWACPCGASGFSVELVPKF